MRIPCTICGSLILPTTVEFNAGLCGQCAREPERARALQTRKRKIAALGAPSVETVKSHLIRLTERAAKKAWTQFGSEQVYAFLLFSDPHFESAVPVVMTEKWLSRMPPGSRWGGSGWYDDDYTISEDDFCLASEWARGLGDPREGGRGDLLMPCYLESLQEVGKKKIFPESTCVLLVSSGMSNEEIYAIAEILNGKVALERLGKDLRLEAVALAAMRKNYATHMK